LGYDPATPYRGAKSLVRDLGTARLLTMRGDGHTAYPGNSPTCIDPAVEAYVNRCRRSADRYPPVPSRRLGAAAGPR
jgi:TAP-like protein